MGEFHKMSMDEQELVQRIQQGDEMAFAEVVRIYKDRIVNYLWQLTGDYQRAVELSQETFMRVYFRHTDTNPSRLSPRGSTLSHPTWPGPS
ncbi:MAG: RNA polymerase sigma factor [Candidatus Aminicenantales bacterium]